MEATKEMTLELNLVADEVAQGTSELLELTSLQLALVGGGSGNVMLV